MARAAKKKVSKKKAGKKKAGRAVAPAKSKALTSWDEELAQYATDDKARTAATEGNAISIRGGVFRYQGQEVGDTLKVIILDFAHTKAWFDGPYDEDNPSTPACAALTYSGKEAAPYEDVPVPQTESGICADCWANQFESANVGRGKACKDGRRLVVLDPNELDGELAIINLPPTSIRKFDGYISSLARIGKGRPCFSVITDLSFDQEEDYPVVVETMVGMTEDHVDDLALVMARRREATELVQKKPWDFTQYEPPKPRGKKKAAAKKKAGRKKVGKKKAGARSKFT